MPGASHFVLSVANQARSTSFYSEVLATGPRLNVPGMTEFELPGGASLGLMPITGIRGLLGDALPDPGAAHGIPRAELYLLVEAPDLLHTRAVTAGAKELSPLQPRSWGHSAAYSLDPDGHVLAFASHTVTAQTGVTLQVGLGPKGNAKRKVVMNCGSHHGGVPRTSTAGCAGPS